MCGGGKGVCRLADSQLVQLFGGRVSICFGGLVSGRGVGRTQMASSNVSWRFDVNEQKVVRGLQAIGSMKPHVPFRYFGCGKPTNPVSSPLTKEVWLALNRFCQLPDRLMYFSWSAACPRPWARVAAQKSL